MRRCIGTLVAFCMFLLLFACAKPAPSPEASPAEAIQEGAGGTETAATVEDPTPEPTLVPVLPLTAGVYSGDKGERMWLYALEDGNRAGLISASADGEGMPEGIRWTDDTLVIEQETIGFTYFDGVLRFPYHGNELTLLFRPEAATEEIREADHLGLGDTLYSSAYGDTAAFHTDGSGILSVSGGDPVPVLWGCYTDDKGDNTPYVVQDSCFFAMTLTDGILTLQTGDGTNCNLSQRQQNEITGTVVTSPEYQFTVTLNDPDWSWEKTDSLYNFTRSDGLAFCSLYSMELGKIPGKADLDEGLEYYLQQLNGTKIREIEDHPVAGLPGRALTAKLEIQGHPWETVVVIFHEDSFVYYFSCTEHQALSDATVLVVEGLLDSFSKTDF